MDCTMEVMAVGLLCTIVGLIGGCLITLGLIVCDKIKYEEIRLWFQEF
jgi:hypothetical protein